MMKVYEPVDTTAMHEQINQIKSQSQREEALAAMAAMDCDRVNASLQKQ